MLGPAASAVCKLVADEHVDIALGLGEGIESSLSLRQFPECHGIPVWACMSAGELAKFPALPGIEALHIAVDNDPAGIKAANELAQRWHDAGREVFMLQPLAARADANDLVRGQANG
jgi:putative DNA primase/helicase